jgi:hypothetical protein
MERDISRLEQAWLQAETRADEARGLAVAANRALETVKTKPAGEDVGALLSRAEGANAEHAAAEQMASEAFDRLWQAKALGPSLGQSQEQMNA